MTQRLKYIKDINGNFLTQGIVRTVDRIELRAGFVGGDPKSPTTGFIKSVGGDAVNIQIQGSSHWKIKMKLKKALIKLGVQFNIETRKPRKQALTE